jgi:hypothetical protein
MNVKALSAGAPCASASAIFLLLLLLASLNTLVAHLRFYTNQMLMFLL